MAVTAEDGTGRSDADVYVSVADADAYWAARANGTWAEAAVTAKEAALLEATQFLDASWRWPGTVKTVTQALGWPRADAFDIEGRPLVSMVPGRVKDATCELALLALSERLMPAPARGGQIRRTREKAGPVEEEIEYMDGAPSGRSYGFVARLLSTVAIAGPGQVKARRG